MPSPTLRFLAEALVEAEEAAGYYERMRPGLGARFRQELEFKCRSIAQNPLLWNERRGGFRRANLGGFPHYVAYFVEADEIVIAAIAHASPATRILETPHFMSGPLSPIHEVAPHHRTALLSHHESR